MDGRWPNQPKCWECQCQEHKFGRELRHWNIALDISFILYVPDWMLDELELLLSQNPGCLYVPVMKTTCLGQIQLGGQGGCSALSWPPPGYICEVCRILRQCLNDKLPSSTKSPQLTSVQKQTKRSSLRYFFSPRRCWERARNLQL